MAPTSLNSNAAYALIAGHGRSGTNWLLHLLDRAAATHCRNEPNEIAGNEFAALPSPFVPVVDPTAFAEPWSRAVAEALMAFVALRLLLCGALGVSIRA